jgi:hypothetical protein
MTDGTEHRRKDPEDSPASDPASSSTSDLEGSPASSAQGARERCGPLLLERHRKADGRALILYRVAEADG